MLLRCLYAMPLFAPTAAIAPSCCCHTLSPLAIDKLPSCYAYASPCCHFDCCRFAAACCLPLLHDFASATPSFRARLAASLRDGIRHRCRHAAAAASCRHAAIIFAAFHCAAMLATPAMLPLSRAVCEAGYAADFISPLYLKRRATTRYHTIVMRLCYAMPRHAAFAIFAMRQRCRGFRRPPFMLPPLTD